MFHHEIKQINRRSIRDRKVKTDSFRVNRSRLVLTDKHKTSKLSCRNITSRNRTITIDSH